MATEHNKTDAQIVSEQLDFFARNRSGCGFAARAARSPDEHEWAQEVIWEVGPQAINDTLAGAIGATGVSTLSMIFPTVSTDQEFDAFLPSLLCDLICLHETEDTERNRCYRFRATIGEDQSLVSGFAPFAWLPVTRRAPYVSVVIRVKPRPDYDWLFKEPEPGVIHIADMKMLGMTDRQLQQMWKNSFLTTNGLLGKKPDEESAARTTFIVPLPRANQISI